MALPSPEQDIDVRGPSPDVSGIIAPLQIPEGKIALPEKRDTAPLPINDTEQQDENVGPYAAPRSKLRTTAIMAALFVRGVDLPSLSVQTHPPN